MKRHNSFRELGSVGLIDSENSRIILRVSVLVCAVILSFALFPETALSQNPGTASQLGLGAEIGIWRPNDLSDNVTLSFVTRTKDHPYLGFVLMKPMRYGLTLRGSPGYWKYCDDSIPEETKTIEILSFLVDLKYALLSDVRLLPYVSYGIGWFLGREKKEDDSHFKFSEASQAGIGVNVGTGFDFKLASKIFAALEFRYHYIKFNKVVAFTNNYSGAKVSLAFYYLF
ncbi:MAG: porin family protein [bacterium]|nr:porin family protein [bacterium]